MARSGSRHLVGAGGFGFGESNCFRSKQLRRYFSVLLVEWLLVACLVTLAAVSFELLDKAYGFILGAGNKSQFRAERATALVALDK